MANPSQVSCPVGEYTKVITNKTTGNVFIQELAPPRVPSMTPVYVARKDTGEDAPTTHAASILLSDNTIALDNTAASDLYIYPVERAITVVVDV